MPDDDPYTAVVCVVDDVDAHYARAMAAGARIDKELTDEPWGDRMYRCTDPFGRRWSLLTHVRDVAPEDWGAVGATA